MKHGDVIKIKSFGRVHTTTVDRLPDLGVEAGYITVAGWKGRAGPASVRVEDVVQESNGDDRC